MNDEKGKGKASEPAAKADPPDDSSANQELPAEPSFLSRVTDSAQGLARSALTAPTSRESNTIISSALSNSNKGSTLGTLGSGSSWRESSNDLQNSSTSRSSHTGSDGLQGSRAFRNAHQQEHIQKSEAQFSDFLNGIDSFQPSDEFLDMVHSNDYNDAWSRAQAPSSSQDISRTVAEQEFRDGEDVAAILNSKTMEDVEDFEPATEEDGDFDWGLSEEQLKTIRTITKELFPSPPQHDTVAMENSLNLLPQSDFGTITLLMGHAESNTSEQWMEQWEGVLTRYADEVWGGLLPLVKEVREEIADIKRDPVIKEPPAAVRRLEAILGHMQKR